MKVDTVKAAAVTVHSAGRHAPPPGFIAREGGGRDLLCDGGGAEADGQIARDSALAFSGIFAFLTSGAGALPESLSDPMRAGLLAGSSAANPADGYPIRWLGAIILCARGERPRPSRGEQRPQPSKQFAE
jgi:hypothetical protein